MSGGMDTKDVPSGRVERKELGSFPLTSYEVEAWEEGTVGWACVKETITSSSGTFERWRRDYVLHLERGEWKVVHVHWSVAKPNVEFLGQTLTSSLAELEELVQREQPDLSATLAADGTVTIVFTDIVDSTVLTSRLGDPNWRDVLRRHDTVIYNVTESHGGTVVETQGDGSMLAFSSARRAVGSAQAIQSEMSMTFADDSPPIRVRIGVPPAMRFRKLTGSSAPRFTTLRESPAKRSVEKSSSRMSYASLSRTRGSSSLRAERSS